MARLRDLLLPWTSYRAVRDQLGSVRGIYARRDGVQRRRDFGPARAPVLLLHGFFQTRDLWHVMEQRLREDGYPVASFHLGSERWRFNTRPIDANARAVAAKVERMQLRYGIPGVHVIGHSMGGLVARAWIQHHGGHQQAWSLTTLGTPHHGTPTAAVAIALMGFGLLRSSAPELLPRSALLTRLGAQPFPARIPLLSVYSRDDLVCPHWCSRVHAPHRNVEVDDVGHSQLAWDPAVYAHVRAHLRAAEHTRTTPPDVLPTPAPGC